MRILNIIPSLAPETGGPVEAVMKLCRALANDGNKVTLFTTNWPEYDSTAISSKEKIEQGFRILTFPSEPSGLTSRLPRSPKLIRALRDSLEEFDLFIVHSLWNPLATFAMQELRRMGIKYCLMPHGMLDPVVLKRNRWKKLPWFHLWERFNIKEASLIIFNTEGEERKALKTDWHFKKTFVFPHIVDLCEWKELPSRSMFEAKFPVVKEREVILFVGRINWVKNLDRLLEALAIVRQKRPSAMLVCIGPDSDGYRLKLEKRAEMLGIDDFLLFTGMMNREDLKMAYARGDVLTLVSQKENFGLVVAEALASGLPVVLSEGVDAGRDLSSHGPVRRVLPVPEEIAKALLAMLERSGSLGLPDLEARKLAEKAWGDPDSSVQKLTHVFREIIGEEGLAS